MSILDDPRFRPLACFLGLAFGRGRRTSGDMKVFSFSTVCLVVVGVEIEADV